jgi:hypothetical protein
MTEPPSQKALKALDAIVDKVLAYKPKPKTKPAKNRKKRAAKIAKEAKSFLVLRQPPKDSNISLIPPEGMKKQKYR